MMLAVFLQMPLQLSEEHLQFNPFQHRPWQHQHNQHQHYNREHQHQRVMNLLTCKSQRLFLCLWFSGSLDRRQRSHPPTGAPLFNILSLNININTSIFFNILKIFSSNIYAADFLQPLAVYVFCVFVIRLFCGGLG